MGLPSVGSPFGVCGWFFHPFLSSLFDNSKCAPMDLGSYSTHLGLPVWEGRVMQHHGLKEDGLCLLPTATGPVVPPWVSGRGHWGVHEQPTDACP